MLVVSRHVRANYCLNAPCDDGRQCRAQRPVECEILAASQWLLMAGRTQ
jgi:hypothetical protein